jgi:hypothetical protein
MHDSWLELKEFLMVYFKDDKSSQMRRGCRAGCDCWLDAFQHRLDQVLADW